ncbi:MAG: cytochrome c3 family protein [Pirellulaceae bacterium]
MQDSYRSHHTNHRSAAVYVLLGLACMTVASCGFRPRNPERSDTELGREWPQSPRQPAIFREASYGVLRDSVPVVEGAEFVNDDELCLNCHKVYAETMQQNVHRGIGTEGHACEACHGPASEHLKARGKTPGLLWNFRTMQPAQAAEVCLKCHEKDACSPGAQWRTSVHAHNNLTCTSCHTGHYNVPAGTKPTTEPGEVAQTVDGQVFNQVSFQETNTTLPPMTGQSNNLGAVAPTVCYRCHGDKQDMQQIAGPHQICGPNNFNCTTCHDPHGKILESSRQQLCLNCHQSGSPTMAWHSSTHAVMGVACTDCHSPHASANVPEIVGISHFDVARPKRLPMSVNDPVVCFKCHADIFAKLSLPSHHPVKEGKLFCGDCHDAHGQMEGNLKAETLNLLCWKCHADKQGPFAYEHPPVTENCAYCHSPHGTVQNNLLQQPTTFLCLRCHVGHRDGDHGGGARVNIDTIPQIRSGFYSDCTTCHSQIHGSDLPTPHFPAMFR